MFACNILDDSSCVNNSWKGGKLSSCCKRRNYDNPIVLCLYPASITPGKEESCILRQYPYLLHPEDPVKKKTAASSSSFYIVIKHPSQRATECHRPTPCSYQSPTCYYCSKSLVIVLSRLKNLGFSVFNNCEPL